MTIDDLTPAERDQAQMHELCVWLAAKRAAGGGGRRKGDAP